MFRIVIVLALIGVVLFFLFGKQLKSASPQQYAALVRKLLLGGAVALLIFLALTGRLHWAFAALGGLLPLIQRLFMAYRQAKVVKGWLGGRRGRQAGQSSKVETRYLRMQLHHDTGELSGVVLAGQFQGRRLDELSHEQLIALLRECQVNDEESARLLEAYLDRTLGPEWRQSAGEEAGGRGGNGGGPMTLEEAYDILGLSPGAGEKEIRAAHRRLMQKLHPDRGGPTYLAAKINKAKDVLLNGRG